MTTDRTYTDPRCTRKNWPSGPWDDEPDKVEWIDAGTGLPCVAKRHPDFGHWCGYVGVPSQHPLHGAHYNGIDFEVHGGLTYSGLSQPGHPAEAVAHADAPEHTWWLGFHCHWYCDIAPKDLEHEHFYRLFKQPEPQYRPLAYVRSECALLAYQLAAVAGYATGEVHD
jgi:hypothetical protein